MKRGRGIEYRKEFFDREYTAKEAYSRLWQYARRYRFRVVVGIVCGMLTAGTLIPFFQVIQPALDRVGAQDAAVAAAPDASPAVGSESAPAAPAAAPAAKADDSASAHAPAPAAKADKKAKGLLKQYEKARRLAARFGIELQGADDALGLPLMFAIVVVVPLVALVRCALVFLNHYCLTWAGMHTVKDLRCDVLHRLQEQSLQFHGRIDVGQLMSRATSDPRQVQLVIQHVLQELAQAPFEIAVSAGFIVWTAVANGMLPTLGVIVIGFPLFMLPVVFLSKRIRKWSKKALERFSVVGSRIHEILTCVKVVKAYHTEEYENEKYDAANRNMLKATLRAVRWGLLVGPAVETVGIVLLCGFVVWCFLEHVRLSSIVPMLAPLLVIYKPLKQLSKIQVQIEQGRAALARIYSILDVDMRLPERADPVRKPSFDRGIAFEGVSFRSAVS